jgi:hypothetical protein
VRVVLGNIHIRFMKSRWPATTAARVHTYVRPFSQPTVSREQEQEATNLTDLLARCYAEGYLASADVLQRANEDPGLFRLLPNRVVTVTGLRRFRRCHHAQLVKELARVLLSQTPRPTALVENPRLAAVMAWDRIHLAQLLDVGLEDD